MVMTPYVNEWSQIIASFLPENVREGRTTWTWETILLLISWEIQLLQINSARKVWFRCCICNGLICFVL